jgi:prepilin-type N-terminal cleavage/methylation domain-containing protein
MIKHQGFTLLELMLSIVLGLLIVAAALSLFIGSGRSNSLQTGMGELQQNANFGLSMMAKDIRHANLNTASNQKINKTVNGSGVIFTKANIGSTTSIIETNKYVTLAANNQDGTEGKSDQLTIQFMPQYVVSESSEIKKDDAGNEMEDPVTHEKITVRKIKSETNMFDCEGTQIQSTISDDGDSSRILTESKPIVVQRYYIDELAATFQTSGASKRFGLYCDAGRYESGAPEVTGLGANAQLVMQDIEAFKIRFGIKSNEKFRYVTAKQYVDTYGGWQIISVELGLLARSSGSIGGNQALNTTSTYKIAGQDVVLDATTNEYKKYLRQVVTQVVGFRNTLGASL